VTVYQPLYRLTVYSPRSVDIDEATVLVPRAGALHSNPFRVATKDHGKAVRIGATNARYLIRNPVGTWPTTSLTLEFWGRIDAAIAPIAQGNWGATYAGSGAIDAVLCGLGSTGTARRQAMAINNVFLTAGTDHPADGVWYHLCYTWRSSDGLARLFRNGVQVATGNISSGFSIPAAGAFVVGQEQDAIGGSFDATEAWKGDEDEVRVYNRILSDAEIKQHAGGIYIDETGLCGRWGFDLDGVPALGRDSAGLNDLTPVGIDAGTDDTILHFKPYLQEPESGPSGKYHPLKRTLQTRALTAGLVDPKVTPGQNLNRYVTQYLGDTKNRNQLLGLKTRWEESLDGGFTWAAFFTGRMDLTQLEEKNAYSADVLDGIDELDVDIFVGRPHSAVAAYAPPPQIWPVGPAFAYGGLVPSLPIKGKIQAATGFVASAAIKAVLVDAAELSNPRNRTTATLEEVASSFATSFATQVGLMLGSYFPEGITYSQGARLKLKRLDTLATGQFKLGLTRHDSRPGSPDIFAAALGLGFPVAELVLAEVDATDVNYLAMPPNGTAVECSVILTDQDPSADAPLLIGDVHRVQLLKDLLLGYFGRLKKDGAPVRQFVPEPTSFAALIADQTIGTVRFKIEKRAQMRAFVEQSLLRDGNLGWRLDAEGRVVVFDTRRPSTLAGILTITDADTIEATDAFKWKQGREGAITQIEAKWYVDLPIGPDGATIAPPKLGVSPTMLLRTVVQRLLILDFGRSDMGERRETIDAIGCRAMPGELVQGQSRASYIRRQLERTIEELRAPFGTGPAEATLRCRRTANTSGWQQGQLRIIDIDAMPDPATNARGGARLMLCTQRRERGPEIEFSALDLGPNVIAAAPTLSGLATDTDDTAHGISVTLTLNAANNPIEMHYAVTDSGVGTRPVESDPLWTFGVRVKTTGAVKVINLPAGKKVWVRARSVIGHDSPLTDPGLVLPSVWAFPGTDNVTLASLAAWSGLGTTELTGRRVVITGTPGDTRLPTEVLLATPTSDPRVRVKTLPPGATRCELVDLELSTQYRAELRQRDSLGGFSAGVTIDFTTTGSAATAPNPGGIAIVIGAA
jgi:hypothetical protein